MGSKNPRTAENSNKSQSAHPALGHPKSTAKGIRPKHMPPLSCRMRVGMKSQRCWGPTLLLRLLHMTFTPGESRCLQWTSRLTSVAIIYPHHPDNQEDSTNIKCKSSRTQKENTLLDKVNHIRNTETFLIPLSRHHDLESF